MTTLTLEEIIHEEIGVSDDFSLSSFLEEIKKRIEEYGFLDVDDLRGMINDITNWPPFIGNNLEKFIEDGLVKNLMRAIVDYEGEYREYHNIFGYDSKNRLGLRCVEKTKNKSLKED